MGRKLPDSAVICLASETALLTPSPPCQIYSHTKPMSEQLNLNMQVMW